MIPPRIAFAGNCTGPDRQLIAHFLDQDCVGAENAYPPAHCAQIQSDIEKAFMLADAAEPEAAAVICRSVGVILVAREGPSAGASRGDALGVVWLAPADGWTAADCADAMWHETVHQALFLEQMVRGLYLASVSEMAEESALVPSAIRRTKRPYDLAFHAACVASSLVGLNRAFGRHIACRTLVEGLQQTLPALREKAAFLSPNGQAILMELTEETARQSVLLGAPASA